MRAALSPVQGVASPPHLLPPSGQLEAPWIPEVAGTTDLTFTVPRPDYTTALRITEESGQSIGAEAVEGDDEIAKVSIVGLGMKDHAGVASRMFSALADEGINIQLITTSEIKVSVVIEEKYTELAVRALHAAFVETGASEVRSE